MVFARKNLRLASAPTATALPVLILLLLAACGKPAPQAEAPRPVRAIVLTASNTAIKAEFSGDVRARVESRLGFRVGGKITSRKVDVGTLVKR
ncbi:MAG: efflux transporter periplasmic adaptor subunit, partial [Telluria sp.]